MAGELKLDDTQLLAAIDELRRVSHEEQEAAILELEEKYPGVGNRARALLALEKQAAADIARAEADGRRIVAEAKAEAEVVAKWREAEKVKAAGQVKFHESDLAPKIEAPITIEEKNAALDELADLWSSDPLAYAEKIKKIKDQLGVSQDAVSKAVKLVRDKRPQEEEQSQATKLMALGFKEGVQLWHSADGAGYSSMLVDGHWEHYRIRSSGFDSWLRDEYGRANRVRIGDQWVSQVPGAQAVRDAMAGLEGHALRHGGSQTPAMRVGGDDKVIWIDLGGRNWNAVKVTAEGWKVEEDVDIPFVRTPTMLPLPRPVRGGNVQDLRRVMNIQPGDISLVAAWLAQAWNPIGDYPFIDACGDSETGKTFACVTLLTTIDPRTTKLRRLRNVDDLLTGAKNNWTLGFDNWSTMPRAVADTLCMISTEISSGSRKLYTDDEEHTFTVRRPIVFNGIPGDLTERSDLASRTILLSIPPIVRRRTKADLEREFSEIWPGVLGSLLDGLVGGLRNGREIVVNDPARLMDFEQFGEAACRAMGFDEWEFIEAYKANRHRSMMVSVEASAVGRAIVKLLKRRPEGFRGQMSVLYEKLESWRGNASGRDWPKDPARLSTELSRIRKPLASVGIACLTKVDRRYDKDQPGSQQDVVLEYSNPRTVEKPMIEEPKVIPIVQAFKRRI